MAATRMLKIEFSRFVVMYHGPVLKLLPAEIKSYGEHFSWESFQALLCAFVCPSLT